MATIDTIADRSTGSAIAGKAYFETSTNKFIVYNGSAWIEIDSDGTGAVPFQNRWGASFDGSDDKLTVSDSSLDISGDLTMSFWFKADAFGTWNYPLILTTFPNTSASAYMGRCLGFNGANLSSLTYYDHNSASTTLNTGQWYHAAVVYERTAGTDTGFHTIYLNGSVDLTRTSVNLKDITYVETQIGKSYNANHFDGLLDDVAIFNSALDQTAITALYGAAPNAGIPSEVTGAIGYWRMGDDSNDTATSGGSIATITDSSGNGNDMVQATASKQPTFSDLTGETIYV